MVREGTMVHFGRISLMAVMFAALFAMPAGADNIDPSRLSYSRWVKSCPEGRDVKEVCYTGRDARTDFGLQAFSVALIESNGGLKKVFRATLPLGLQLAYGARVIVDQIAPITAPFSTCDNRGCVADFEASADIISSLKGGRQLTVQAIQSNGQTMSLPLPLADFAKVNDGPATDPNDVAYQRELARHWPRKDDTLQPHLRPSPR
jgi:invasion protein IalB